MPFVTSSFLFLVVKPGATGSVLAPSKVPIHSYIGWEINTWRGAGIDSYGRPYRLGRAMIIVRSLDPLEAEHDLTLKLRLLMAHVA